MSKVKLYLYTEEEKQTMIDIYAAREFDEFMLVEVPEDMLQDQQNIQHLQDTLSRVQSGKQFIIIPDNLKISFYGVREEDDDRSISCVIPDQGHAGEISGDTPL